METNPRPEPGQLLDLLPWPWTQEQEQPHKPLMLKRWQYHAWEVLQQSLPSVGHLSLRLAVKVTSQGKGVMIYRRENTNDVHYRSRPPLPPTPNVTRTRPSLPSYPTYTDALLKHSKKLREQSMSPTRNLTVVNTERFCQAKPSQAPAPAQLAGFS